MPHEHHDTAGNHAGQSAPLIAALPEQRQQNNGSEGCAEACPGEGHDAEHGAVGIAGDKHANHRDNDHGNACHPHGRLLGHLDAEQTAQQVLRHAGGSCQQLAVCGGHGAGQNTCQHQTGHQCKAYTLLAQQICNLNDSGLRLGLRTEGHDGICLRHGVSHNTDHDSDGHGNNHPDRGDTAGNLDLFGVLDAHEAQQDVGHTEVAQTPGHGGNDGQESIVADLSGGHIAQFGQAQIARHIVGIVAHSRPTAGRLDAEHQNDDQRQRHDDGLNQVGGGHRQETAQNGVDDDNCGTDQHGSRVVKAEQAVEQLTDGGKAGSGVGDEEYDNDKGANAAQELPVVRKALGNELRYGDGVDLGGVNA